MANKEIEARRFSPPEIKDMVGVWVWIDLAAELPVHWEIDYKQIASPVVEKFGLGQLSAISEFLQKLFYSREWTFRPFLSRLRFGIVAKRKEK